MSLNVYLYSDKKTEMCYHCGEMHRKEYFNLNITHNLNKMADVAGLYDACWRPYKFHNDYVESEYDIQMKFEESNVIYAWQLIKPIEEGLTKLKSDPEFYKKLNPSNGWGNYEGLVKFIEEYLEALKDYPNSIVEASR